MLFGNPAQLGIQATAVAAAIVYSGGMSFVLLKLVGAIMPLRADVSQQDEGLDLSQHGEEAYIHGEGAASISAAGMASQAVSHLKSQTARP